MKFRGWSSDANGALIVMRCLSPSTILDIFDPPECIGMHIMRRGSSKRKGERKGEKVDFVLQDAHTQYVATRRLNDRKA